MDDETKEPVFLDPNYQFITDLHFAADEAAEYGADPSSRVYLGIPQLDEKIRGTAKRHLTVVLGRPNGGKTLVIGNMLLANPNRIGLYATPDESRLLVIAKLTAALHDISWATLERDLQSPDVATAKRARDLMHETADRFPNLAVCEVALNSFTLTKAIEETEDMKGGKVEFVIYDFSKLFREDGDEAAKLDALKYWAIEQQVPLFVPHQVPKYSGRDGAPINLDSMRMGGEDVATHMIGVRRKWRWYQSLIDEWERKLDKASHGDKPEIEHQIAEFTYERDLHRDIKPSVTVNLVKNKVPPGDTVDEFDMLINPQSGKLSQMDGFDPPRPEPAPNQKRTAWD